MIAWVSTPRHGFTLLELIFVLAIAAGLFTLATMGGTALMQGAAIDAAGQMLNDGLTEARQDAVTQNIPVEVRIYHLSPTNGGPAVYGSFQLHWIRPDGTTPAISRPILLPITVVIDETADHSSLIASNSQTATSDSTDSRLNSETRVFHFLADGSTDLDATGKWFLTVRAATQADPAHFPSNWACVEVNPTSGRTQLYRP